MLQLGDECVTFEKGSSLAETFYDNLNERICTVRGNGAMGITGKKVQGNSVISLRIRDLGRIRIIKFNKTDRYLAVQRHDNTVDIVVIEPGSVICNTEVSQSCKMKTAKIKAIEWVTVSQFLLITTQGLELYQIDERKHTVKLLKTLNSVQDWSIFHPATSLLILASGPSHSQLQPIVIKSGQFYRLTKFEVDFGISNANTHLLEQNVSVEVIYGKVYIRTLRFSRRDTSTSDVALYEIPNDTGTPAKLAYVLTLGLPGMFGVHIIDSLVIVHLQQQRRSLIFDVGIRPDETNQWAIIEIEMTSSPSVTTLTAGVSTPLYTHGWVIFTPDIVIDPDLGIFSKVTLRPELSVNYIKDTMLQLSFLLNRVNGKKAALAVLCEAVQKRALKSRELSRLFDAMNTRLAAKEAALTAPAPGPASKALSDLRSPLIAPSHDWPVVTQEALQSFVFIPASEAADVESKRYVANAQLAYIRSLRKHAVAVDPYLMDSLVETLVAGGETSRLYQLVNYRTIGDSKPLAFLLLSYEARYPPLFQAGVDMLMRSGSAIDEMAEVLLAKGHLIEALRYTDSSSSLSDQRPSAALRVLDSASKCERPIRHALHTFLTLQRRTKNGWSEQMKTFEKEYRNLYAPEEIEEADRQVAFADASLEMVTV